MSVYTLCMASHRYTPSPARHRLYPSSRTAQALLAFTVLVVVCAAIQYWYITLAVAVLALIVYSFRTERA